MTISGMELPKPMTNIPMSNGGTPSPLAVAAAPSTNLSALMTSDTRPTPTAITGHSMGMASLPVD